MLNVTEESLFFIVVASSMLFLLFVSFFVAFVQLYRRKQMMADNQRKERERAFSEELIRSQLEIREGLMRQMSDELHDNIGQSLVVAKMQLNSIQKEAESQQAVAANELIGRALQDLRNMSKTLNGQYILREGIVEALKKEIAYIDSARQINCSLEGFLNMNSLPADHEIILFRCVQELLSNVIKHADASEIRIHLKETDKNLSVDVIDNGKGLPPNWEMSRGLGMDNLHKRVELMGGELKSKSSAAQGTHISIILPTQPIIEQ